MTCTATSATTGRNRPPLALVPPARADRHPLLRRAWRLLRDVAYGVHAAHGIRHGVPVPPQVTPRRCGPTG